jgi:hypothetical protein
MGETLNKIIKIVTGIVIAFLGLELILRLLGALPTVFIFQWIYDIAGILKSPFANILPAITFGSRFVLDLSTLFAMIAYSIFAGVLIWLINYSAKGSSKH